MSDDDFGVVSTAAAARPAQAAAAAAKHWSPARQRAAKPLPLPALTVEQHEEMMAEVREAQRRDGSGGVVVRPLLVGGPPRPASSPGRETKRVDDMAAYPYSVALKMLMSFGGSGYIGTGFIVGRRAVLTAGHCVYDAGGFAQNIQFTPRFRNGSGPDGGFAAVHTTVLREYTELPDGRKYAYDVGACVVDRDFPPELGVAGYSIGAVLAAGKLRSIGYPGEPYRNFGFDGQAMWTSLGDYYEEGDGGRGTTRERNWGHYNDMTGGCSGGPIFATGSEPVVVGLNSHVLLQHAGGPREEPPRMYSPYFGESIRRLVEWLRANGGRPNEEGDEAGPPAEEERKDDLKAGLRDVVARLNQLIAQL